MNTSGGFLLDTSSSSAQPGPSSTSKEVDAEGDEGQGSVAVRKLTSRQETRLMDYLDDAFLQINRGYNKRHNAASSSVPTLTAFVAAFDPILAIIASIPPIGPSASLLVSYLLRFSNELLDGVISYEAADRKSEDDSADPTSSLDAQLQKVIESLGLLDRVWSCVLRGQMIDLEAAKTNVKAEGAASNFDDSFPFSSVVSGEEAGRFPPMHQLHSQSRREARSIIGSKGFSTVAQTNRIRLRNLLTLAKESLFAWMRVQLDVPLPPRVDGADAGQEEPGVKGEEEDQTSRTSVKVDGEGDEDEDEDDLEEVETGDTTARQTKGEGEYHFDALFARTIDPDADGSDEEQQQPDEEGRIVKRAHSSEGQTGADGESSSPPKRVRRQPSSDPSPSPPPSDMESMATFSGTAAVMKWDVRFARLFAHTQRCLSDIQEYSNRQGERRQGQEG